MERVPGRVWQIVCEAGLQNPIRSMADLEVETVAILLVRIAVARERRRLNVESASRDDPNFGGRRSGGMERFEGVGEQVPVGVIERLDQE